jgi:F-type H+-transporting ATPase subunit a
LPLPFMCLELMVAVIQAIVFAMLTMAFMSIMTEKH